MDQDITSILLTSLSYAVEPDKAEKLASVSAEQWFAVVEMARLHNVDALLYYRLKLLGIALPSGLAEELQQKYRQDALRNARLYQQLAKLFRILHEKDVPVIVLKGAFLAEAVYPDIGLRSMADVDLLVKKDDLLFVEEELLKLGAEPEEKNRTVIQEIHHFCYYFPKNNLRLEIHWTIVDARYPTRLDLEELWNRAQPILLAKTPVWVLSPEDLLLHLCLHTASHTFDMDFRMLCDIGEVLRHFGRQLDWPDLVTHARQWGFLHATYLVLRLAQDLLGADIPVQQLTSLQPEYFEEAYFNLAREKILAKRTDEEEEYTHRAARLWGRKGMENKLALAGDRLFPSRESMALKYPASANSWRIYLYYPVRVRDMLRLYGPHIWKLVRGGSETRTAVEVTHLREWLMSG